MTRRLPRREYTALIPARAGDNEGDKMNAYSSLAHPHHADYEYGMKDALAELPSPEPEGRDGDALAAYLAGFADGADNISEYLIDQWEAA